MNTTLSNIKQTFQIKLVITIVVLAWTNPLSVICVMAVASVWTVPSVAMHVLLCYVFLAELGLLPTDLGLTPTHSLYGERTIDTRDTYNHQARKPHFSKDKADHSPVMTSKS